MTLLDELRSTQVIRKEVIAVPVSDIVPGLEVHVTSQLLYPNETGEWMAQATINGCWDGIKGFGNTPYEAYCNWLAVFTTALRIWP